MSSFKYITKQDDELDAICFLFYGKTRGTVEAVLDANRELAKYLPLIPEGQTIILPALPSEAPETPAAVKLWS